MGNERIVLENPSDEQKDEHKKSFKRRAINSINDDNAIASLLLSVEDLDDSYREVVIAFGDTAVIATGLVSFLKEHPDIVKQMKMIYMFTSMLSDDYAEKPKEETNGPH